MLIKKPITLGFQVILGFGQDPSYPKLEWPAIQGTDIKDQDDIAIKIILVLSFYEFISEHFPEEMALRSLKCNHDEHFVYKVFSLIDDSLAERFMYNNEVGCESNREIRFSASNQVKLLKIIRKIMRNLSL